MTTTDHYLIRDSHPGHYGDRPTPWEVTYSCGCGVELWEQFEGSAGSAGTPEDALAEHIAQEAREAVARELNRHGWTCGQGAHEPGQYDECRSCAAACDELAEFLQQIGYEDPPPSAGDALAVTWHGPSRARPYPHQMETAQ